MLLIHCPYCEEERPELEFAGAGEAHIVRPENMADISDEDFEKFFFIRDNQKGIVFERWRHIHGCARFFNAARHSVSDKFIMTYKVGEPKPEISDEHIATVLPPAKGTPANEPIAEPQVVVSPSPSESKPEEIQKEVQEEAIQEAEPVSDQDAKEPATMDDSIATETQEIELEVSEIKSDRKTNASKDGEAQ